MPDTPVEHSGQPGFNPDHETRISRLEDDVRDIKMALTQMVPTLARIDSMLTATLPHLATKAELADLRTEMKADNASLRAELKAEIADLRMEMKADYANLRAEQNGEYGNLRAEFKADTAAIMATLAHLATKAELAEKPSKAYLWGVLAALIAAYGVGLGGLAILLH
jgi:hypothetical protein